VALLVAKQPPMPSQGNLIATLPEVIRKGLFSSHERSSGGLRKLYINRELSWIAFNSRVLAPAALNETEQPLLEQAKFHVACFSNNPPMNFSWCAVLSLESHSWRLA